MSTGQTGQNTVDAGRGLRLSVHAASDVGRMRQQNEDSLYAGETSFAVADGMGGHQAGEVASGLALEPIAELDGARFDGDEPATRALVAAIAEANRSVVDRAASDESLRGMGTTLTAVLVREGRLHVGHVGDSRAYLLRDDARLRQLTTDHTLVEQLIRDGRLTPEEASTHPQRSVITRAIGIEADVEVDALEPFELVPGDQVLLCSDGLTGPVDDEVIARILLDTEDGEAAVRALVDAANDGGGPDNITAVLLRVAGARDDGLTASGVAAAAVGADTGELPPASDSGKRVQIRTRQESGGDWARSMGRYGAPQGVEGVERSPSIAAPRQKRSRGSGRPRRLVAGLLGAALILGILIGGGLFLLSRAFFVGEADGSVVVYQGLSQEVAGIALNRVAQTSDVPVDALSQIRQRRLADGIPVSSEEEGLRLVDQWRGEIADEAEPEPETPATEPPDGEDPESS